MLCKSRRPARKFLQRSTRKGGRERVNEYLIPEEPEYRIYASSQDGVAVIRDISGDERLRLALAIVREWFPEDTIFVREVIEIVREVTAPINGRQEDPVEAGDAV